MTDKDWIKQMQSMMEFHEEPVPDDLWQDIESRLPEHQVPQRPRPAWRRYTAAAAVALAVIGTGGLLWNSQHDGTSVERPAITLTSPEENAPTPEALAQNNDITSHDADAPVASLQITKTPPAKRTPASINEIVPDEHLAHVYTPNETGKIQETSESRPALQPEGQEQQPVEKPTIEPMNATPNPNATRQTIIMPVRKKRPITLGLYAANNIKPDNAIKGDRLFMSLAYTPKLPDFIPLDHPEEFFNAKHHAPISLGLSARIPLTDRLALISGLVYTRLKSDFTSYRKKQEQTLHYVGIPVGLTYAIWGYKRFNVYAIGGMQADFNVKASVRQSTQVGDISISKDRIQFSGMLGPGFQLDLSKDFSIYVEPTARYYFDNGSDIENYFKDKPWNININAGLRLTLE